MSDQPLLLSELPLADGRVIAVACLNAPRALNALSLEMIEQLLPQMQAWAKDARVAAVWLEGAGEKAFCAGGDIVALYRSMTDYAASGDPAQLNPYAEHFFTQEYRLDYLIHTYPKPVIVWGQGIIMGGGMGLFAGASCRVVTEHSRLAMPEISIGLYPDVGGSWFLNRMPGRVGLFLGLTGAQINAADALWVGLADRFICHAFKDEVQQQLMRSDWSLPAQQVIHQVLRAQQARSESALPESPVQQNYAQIQALTDADDPVALIEQLLAAEPASPWLARALANLAAGSTSSMLLIQHQLERCRHASLKAVFQQELNLSVQAALKGELTEGIRALLIDKDKTPRWRYPSVKEVEASWIDGFFVPLWPESPLKDL